MLEGAECYVSNNNKRKKSKNDKRRFSDEQIRCLEMMFESESKLEPRKKMEVARELGLQPRQVAIWFQNKRARWKSKHIEKEYALLLSNYNNLSAQFQSLNKEKHSLQIQLQKLKKEMRGKENEEWAVEEGGSRNGESAEWDKIIDSEVMKNGMAPVSVSDSDDIDSNINAEEKELLRMVDTSDWGTLDSDEIIINQSSCQWWGFWS